MDLHAVTELRAATGASEWRDGDAWLAGGTWLFSEPQPRVRRLLDLTALGWEPVRATDDGLEIAATCTIAQLSRFAAASGWRAAPLFGQCADAFLLSFKVANVATVGGNLCLALPAGPMIALAAALDGDCTIWTADAAERRVAVTDLVVGDGRTSLRPGELLRAISLPTAALESRTALRKASLTALGRSSALVIGRLDPGSGAFTATLTASTVRPVRVGFDVLPDAADLRAALDDVLRPDVIHADVHGLAAWRRHMTLELAEEVRGELAAEAPA
jgi:CO/xanthine dehydrogenase FAD-binding subunit